jgi:hypothetical protein
MEPFFLLANSWGTQTRNPFAMLSNQLALPMFSPCVNGNSELDYLEGSLYDPSLPCPDLSPTTLAATLMTSWPAIWPEAGSNKISQVSHDCASCFHLFWSRYPPKLRTCANLRIRPATCVNLILQLL